MGTQAKMSYKIVQYCRLCKERFTLQKGERRVSYCKGCLEKMREPEEGQAKAI